MMILAEHLVGSEKYHYYQLHDKSANLLAKIGRLGVRAAGLGCSDNQGAVEVGGWLCADMIDAALPV